MIPDSDLQKWQQAIKGIETQQSNLKPEELSAFQSLTEFIKIGNYKNTESEEYIQTMKKAISQYSTNRLLKAHLTNFVSLSEKYFKNPATVPPPIIQPKTDEKDNLKIPQPITSSNSLIKTVIGIGIGLVILAGSYFLIKDKIWFQNLFSKVGEETIEVQIVDSTTSATTTEIIEQEVHQEKNTNYFNEPEMIFVQGGTFIMGCTSDQGNECRDIEKPAHQVTISSFNISKYLVTQSEWIAIMDYNPSVSNRGDNYPVESVSWDEVQEYINRLNSATGKRYRLPTEAEWEYAARGGNKSKGYRYSGSNYLNDVAWYKENSNNGTRQIATKKPNELGIYDMSGNVWEWCNDWYGSYSSSNKKDPAGASTGTHRIHRGGGYGSADTYCRVAYRGGLSPGIIGFRLVLSDLSSNIAFQGRFPQASERLLIAADLQNLSKNDMKIMRNEIFARHGYIFQTNDMKSYFQNQTWYTPRYNDVNSLLTETEKKNIDLIKRYE